MCRIQSLIQWAPTSLTGQHHSKSYPITNTIHHQKSAGNRRQQHPEEQQASSNLTPRAPAIHSMAVRLAQGTRDVERRPRLRGILKSGLRLVPGLERRKNLN